LERERTPSRAVSPFDPRSGLEGEEGKRRGMNAVGVAAKIATFISTGDEQKKKKKNLLGKSSKI